MNLLYFIMAEINLLYLYKILHFIRIIIKNQIFLYLFINFKENQKNEKLGKAAHVVLIKSVGVNEDN